MTTRSLSVSRGDDSGAVAVEWIASTAAAIGLLLCLLAAPGGEWSTTAPARHGVGGPEAVVTSKPPSE
jgi:hypothetical protein